MSGAGSAVPVYTLDSAIIASGTEPVGSAVVVIVMVGVFGTEPSGSAVVIVMVARLKARFQVVYSALSLQARQLLLL